MRGWDAWGEGQTHVTAVRCDCNVGGREEGVTYLSRVQVRHCLQEHNNNNYNSVEYHGQDKGTILIDTVIKTLIHWKDLRKSY